MTRSEREEFYADWKRILLDMEKQIREIYPDAEWEEPDEHGLRRVKIDGEDATIKKKDNVCYWFRYEHGEPYCASIGRSLVGCDCKDGTDCNCADHEIFTDEYWKKKRLQAYSRRRSGELLDCGMKIDKSNC